MVGTAQPFVKFSPAPFETGAATHVGKVRTRNEDSYLVQPDSGIWAVADGMGGHDDGDVASAAVVSALKSIGRPVSAADLLNRCEESVLRANEYLRSMAAERGSDLIGTTVAILLTYDTHYACVWCGDSRIYRLRNGEFSQISHDHTELQEMVDAGQLTPEEAQNWPRRNVITRAIGVQERPELELRHGGLEPGDVFVICSDGLIGHVTDAEIRARLDKEECQAACNAFIDMTLQRGARDNVTVVVVRYRPEIIAAPRQESRPNVESAERTAAEQDPTPAAEQTTGRAEAADPPLRFRGG